MMGGARKSVWKVCSDVQDADFGSLKGKGMAWGRNVGDGCLGLE